ncbi:hypothetical protein V8G54_008927, partial [Vigna mungo]
VTCVCAVGVATAFRALVGGVLFALEEITCWQGKTHFFYLYSSLSWVFLGRRDETRQPRLDVTSVRFAGFNCSRFGFSLRFDSRFKFIDADWFVVQKRRPWWLSLIRDFYDCGRYL